MNAIGLVACLLISMIRARIISHFAFNVDSRHTTLKIYLYLFRETVSSKGRKSGNNVNRNSCQTRKRKGRASTSTVRVFVSLLFILCFTISRPFRHTFTNENLEFQADMFIILPYFIRPISKLKIWNV